MNAPALLKVILGDNSCQRMNFPNGLPGSVNELVSEVQRQCGLHFDIRLQFMDPLFGNDFMNLTSMDEVLDRGTIRVIAMTDSSTPQCANILPTSAAHESLHESSSLSSVDTDILSSPESESSSSRSSWPSIFYVPLFSFDAELKLAQGNAAYRDK
ncbi:uncharacterized protein LOC127364511, partial [Scomber scombrus]